MPGVRGPGARAMGRYAARGTARSRAGGLQAAGGLVGGGAGGGVVKKARKTEGEAVGEAAGWDQTVRPTKERTPQGR